ncbi:MAG: hypothetical protein IKR85_06835 [Clostridia bacterium]|nr:hypothetical protein [Clostridia bacterium]
MGKTATHQQWEGREPNGRFAKITYDMLNSEAWKALTLRQRGLYVQLKAKYYQKVVRGVIVEANTENITMPRSEYMEFYQSAHTFLSDMRKLTECGFIKVKESGRKSRTPNIYAFTDGWIQYPKSKETR